MNEIVRINENYSFLYENVRYRNPTNEEIYEASIRSSVARKRKIYDRVCVIENESLKES